MTVKMTRVRVDRELADEAMHALGVKSRTEAARIAVRWVLGLNRPNVLTPDVAKNRKIGIMGDEREGL
jgi:Arc/MetJ family transcription regulator